MLIRIERSGGLAGIPITNEFNTEHLPSVLKNQIEKIVDNKRAFSLPSKGAPRGAADHYIYKISIGEGEGKRTIICNEYDLQDDIKSLIKQLEKLSKKKLI